MSVNPNSAVIYFNYYAFHHKNNLLFPYIKLQLFSAGIRCCLAVMPLSDLTKIHTQQSGYSGKHTSEQFPEPGCKGSTGVLL